MATSGTYDWNPDFGDLLDEAWERCGKDPASLGARHVLSARRSLNFLLVEWINLGLRLWAIDLQTLTFTESDNDYDLAPETIDITDAVLRRTSNSQDNDTVMYRISRQEYHELHRKDIEGKPDRFYVERRRETAALGPELFVWPTPENSTDVMRYYRLRRLHDADAFADNPEVPFRYLDALAGGLAARLIQKYPTPDIDASAVKADYIDKFQVANREDRERASTRLTVSFARTRGRRR